MEKDYVVRVQYETDDAVKKVNALSNSIIAAKENQKQLDEQMAKGEISQAEYASATAANTHALNRDTQERKKYINVIQAEAGSVKRAKAENQVLREERNKLGDATGKNSAKIAEYNKKIDENTEIIKGNVDKQSQLYMALGNIGGKFGGIIDGFLGMGKAAMAFVMNPIGAIITVIGGVLVTLYKALTSTEAGMAKVNKIGSIFSGIFSGIMKIISPLANFIADKVIVVFEKLGEVAGKAIDLVGKGLSVLGFDKAAAAVDNFNNSIKETVKNSMALSDAQAELVKAQRTANKTQLDFQKQAEKFRQLRDDDSKSIAERIEYNEKLNKTLNDQLAAELAIANKALEVSDLRIKTEGETTEALEERAAALEKISDIQERITGQESEYLMNVYSLKRDAAAKDKAANDEAAKEKEARDKEAWEKEKALLEEKAERTMQEAEWQKEQENAEVDRQVALREERTANRQKEADDKKTIEEKSAADELAAREKAADGIVSAYLSISQATADFFASEDKSAKAFFKMLIGSLIDQVQATIIAMNAKILAQSLASFESVATGGALGIVKAGGIIALTTAAGAAAKAGLQSLGEGGELKFGTFGGNYHSQGGNNLYDQSGRLVANVERDENFYVMKRDASASINALSRVNESFGGRSWTSGNVSHAANGGQVSTQSVTIADVQSIMQNTPIVVKVTDIMGGVNANIKAKSLGVI